MQISEIGKAWANILHFIILHFIEERNKKMPENQESPKKSILKPIQYNSPVILTFALLSFASLLLGYVTDFASTQKFFCVFRSSLTNPLTYLRMFTYVLGHADMAHYVGNFTIILLIGPMLEESTAEKIS